MTSLEWSRRDFIKASLLVSTNLIVGCSFLPKKSPRQREPADDHEVDLKLHAWIIVSTQGKVHLLCDRTEMGQGIFTSHAMIVADELGLDLSDIQVHFAPRNKKEYWNPAFAMNATGGSTSTNVAWLPLRRAAAGVRELLISAAVEEFEERTAVKVKPEDIVLKDHQLVMASGQSIPLGQVVQRAKQMEFPRRPKLKSSFRVVGQSLPRIDLMDKVTGAAKYGIDIQVPEMVHCYVVRSPVLGGKAQSFEASEVTSQKGVISVVPISLGVAVVAETFWQARKAAKSLKVLWDNGQIQMWNSDQYRESLRAAALTPGEPSNIETVLPDEEETLQKNLQVVYELPYVPHSQLEPLNCTVHLHHGFCEIWSGSQVPAAAIEVAHQVSGVPEDNVIFHHTFIGGSFGRRIHHDFLLEAVEVAKLIGRPVKNTWSRETEFQHDFYRPASAHQLTGFSSGLGKIENWRHRIVAPSIFAYSSDEMIQVLLPKWTSEKFVNFVGNFFQDLLKKKIIDPTSVEGARVIPYLPRKMKVEYSHHPTALPIGFWRSVGFAPNAFAVESFIDELAFSVGADPMNFRIEALKAAVERGGIPKWRDRIHKALAKIGRAVHKLKTDIPITILDSPLLRYADPEKTLRLMEVLKVRSEWGQVRSPGMSRGVAQAFCFGSYCGVVIDIYMGNNRIKIHKVTAVVDCGRVVNPDLARAQIEGGIIFGLSAALKQEITFNNNTVDQSSFLECDILRMHEAPAIDIFFMEGGEEPSGVGELGVPPVAPALCNAIFAATGKRIRKLPTQIDSQ